MNRVSVIGGGRMAIAIIYDLIHHQNCQEIQVIERDAVTIEALWKKFPGQDNLTFTQVDIADTEKITTALRGTDVMISAAPYQFNEILLKIAIQVHSHFLDLGGNEDILKNQFKMHQNVLEADLIALPACGLAPGLVSILAAEGLCRQDETSTIHIYCGGLPQVPTGPLNYQIIFSTHGLINEYLEPVKVLENGEVYQKPGLSDWESLDFGSKYGRLEAFLTSGGTGTLISTLKGRVPNIFYKTLRYPGHAEKMKFLFELGFASEKKLPGLPEACLPRQVLEKVMDEKLRGDSPDVVLTRVTLIGKKEGEAISTTYEIVDKMDERTGLTAMMRTTGFSAAICAELIMEHQLEARGVLPLETVIPTDLFLKKLNQRGISVKRIEEPVE